jgi:hypothetical protein
MSTIDELTELILKYLHDRYPGKYDSMTSERLLLQPYHTLIWTWWTALAYYKMSHRYMRLEDAPEGVQTIWVMTDTNRNYIWKDGKYEYLQEFTKEECKGVYGDRIPGR